MSGQAAGLGQRALQHAFPSSCSQEMVGLSLWEWANFLVPVVGGLCLVLSPGCVFSCLSQDVPAEGRGCWQGGGLLSSFVGRWVLRAPADHADVTALKFPHGSFMFLCLLAL